MSIRNLKVIILGVIALLASTKNSSAQILANTNLNLNPGGYINDVAYSEYHDAYVVVGNFTSIGGYSRKNIAFIDRATLTVETASYMIPFSNIDGEIKTVEIIKKFSYGTPDVDSCHLYIGGNFETITIGATNYTRRGIAKLVSRHQYILPVTFTNFTVSSWDAGLDATGGLPEPYSYGVSDIQRIGDTIIFCGNFIDYTFDVYECLSAYNISTGGVVNFPGAYSGTFNWSEHTLYKMCITDNYLFVAGANGINGMGFIYKIELFGGVYNSSQFYYTSNQLNGITDLYELDDSLLVVLESSHSSFDGPDDIVICRQSNGSTKSDHYLTQPSNHYIDAGTLSNKTSEVIYNDKLYVCSGVVNNSLMSFQLGNLSTPQPAPIYWNSGNTTPFPVYYYGNVHDARNRLFVSSSNLTTLSGQSRIGLGIYCLEPKNPQDFIQFQNDVCPLDVDTFVIPTSDYAEGYRWEYSGTGADFQNNGTIDIGPIDLDGTSKNTLIIKFDEFATSGILTVTPYSYCNGTSKLFATSKSISINVRPIPNVNAGLDTVITCYTQDSGIILFGYSDSTNVIDYMWDYGSVVDNIAGQFDTAESTGNYVFKATNIFGCANYDTVFVGIDTIKPNVTLPPSPWELNCINNTIVLNGTSSTPNTNLNWIYAGDSTLTNPLTANAEGQYGLLVFNNTNGCMKGENLFVSADYDAPNIELLEYPSFNITQPIDTITCFQNSLSISGFSDSSNTTVDWINDDTTLFFGSTLIINSPGNYYLFATDNDNGCTNSLGINIAADLNSPQSIAPNYALINCSVDSVELIGSSINNNVTYEWNDGTNFYNQNPIITFNPGWYYFEVTDTSNGCVGIDSVEVVQDNSITIDAGNDVLTCDKELVDLNVTYVGAISGISYLWNNGSTSSTSTFEGGTNYIASVIVSGDGGCIGFDTVSINLPSTAVVNFQGFKPCDGGSTGQIVATPISGAAPFEYSIDNGLNYQVSPIFTNLAIGNYSFLVRDTVGCEYPFSASITENSSSPEAEFLFSTYNFVSDTVALIDVSNPPADSVDWMIPIELIYLNPSEEIPWIMIPDTGVFSITMKAYFGSCSVDVTKLLYASEYDSLHANLYNANGIKSVNLFPNPTTGNFTVEIEFYKEQRCQVLVQDMIGYTYFSDDFEETLLISIPISLDNSAVDGTYLLKVIAEFDSEYVTFILAR